MKFEQNNKKNVKNAHNELFKPFYGQMFIFLSYYVLQKKRSTKDDKEVKKKKNIVMTQLLEACASLPISNASLVPFFI